MNRDSISARCSSPDGYKVCGAAGVRMIDETPRPGAHHMRIAFLHPKSTFGVLTELCEPAGGGGQ